MTRQGVEGGAHLVDHAALRRAVVAFAAAPAQRGALEVLRTCMYGELLLDVTGSDAFIGPPFAAESRLQIRGGPGPNQAPALFAYTDNQQVARLHPPDATPQSLVTPAVSALELARSQNYAWLYIDPAGPTCALSAAEIDFALRNANNAALKQALADHADAKIDRQQVLEVIRARGPMVLAADDSSDRPAVRTVTEPDGSTWLFGFSSAPEVLASDPAAAALSLTIPEVMAIAHEQGCRGIIINPAGPWLRVSLAEIGS